MAGFLPTICGFLLMTLHFDKRRSSSIPSNGFDRDADEGAPP
jgi:hypothetical protein